MKLHIDLVPIHAGFDGVRFFAQARVGFAPGSPETPGSTPTLIVTAQPTLRSGSDVFYELHEFRSTDGGRTWEKPIAHPHTLGRRSQADGTAVAICDMTPRWHHASGRLLLTGHTARYADDRSPIAHHRRETAYSAYDPAGRAWSPWDTVKMPDLPQFQSCGAGSCERIDLPDGSILLPVYCKPLGDDRRACYSAAVLRCAFDGKRLTYLEHGSVHTVGDPRGLCEPSLVRFAGRFFLTCRNDVRGYVSSGEDGLHFEEPIPWRFDDGSDLGNYNTQQHWLATADALYLVYTRRGLNNDHVFRHRAPLMIARVDPDRLVVLRDTEQQVVPNRGARLGNFSVCTVSDTEHWIVVAEWMQPVGCEQYGSDNTIWAAKVTT